MLKKGAGPGRPKGSKNRATMEAREFCQSVVRDKAYQARLLKRAQQGKLPPAVEVMLWAYAFGKPPDNIVLEQNIPPLIIEVLDDEAIRAIRAKRDAGLADGDD